MRLGYHFHVPASQDGSNIRMPGFLGVFIDSLASYCESVTCFMHEPVSGEIDLLGYQIKSHNVYLVSIGKHTSVPKRLVNTYNIRKKILSWQNKLDVLIVRTPTPLIHIFSKKFTVTIALHIVADYLAGIDQLPQPFWRKEIIRLFARWNYKHQLKIAKKAIVFTASESLYRNYQVLVSNVSKIITTTLTTNDIFVRNDTCENNIIKLLFVGRFEKSKGLFELYLTLSQLKNNCNLYKLFLVGWPGKDDTILEELDNYAINLGVQEMIINLGYKQFGEELFDVYKNADIYVMPTKYDEFGRTIWEAMAHSLPVITTKVGSIPLQLNDGLNAVLVEPGDSKAFTDAIIKVTNNKKFRQNLIKQGRELAGKNTLQVQSKKMINELKRYITEKLDKK